MRKRIGIIIFTILMFTGCQYKEKVSLIVPLVEAFKETLYLQAKSNLNDSEMTTEDFLLGTWIADEKVFEEEIAFTFDLNKLTVTYGGTEETAVSFDYKVKDQKLYLLAYGEEVESGTLQVQKESDTFCLISGNESTKFYRGDSDKAEQVKNQLKKYWIGDWILVDEESTPISHWVFTTEDELVRKNLGKHKETISCKVKQTEKGDELTIDQETYVMVRDFYEIEVKCGESVFHLLPVNSSLGKESMKRFLVLDKDGSIEKRSYEVEPIRITLSAPNNIFLEDVISLRPYKECELPGAYGMFYEIKIQSVVTKDAVVEFCYRVEDLLYDCEKDLAIGYMDTKNGEIAFAKSTYDHESSVVSVPFQGDGFYFLVDQYIYNGNERDYASMNPYATEWAKHNKTGDICSLIDFSYLKHSNGTFQVHNAKELASVVFYVNTHAGTKVISLLNDIDLSSYEWASMGWGDANNQYPFEATIEGNSHVISGMKIDGDSDVGFLGWSTFCQVSDLTIKDATVSGASRVAILNGQAICGKFDRCHVSGTVTGDSDVGTMFGHEANGDINECSADAMVNGKKNEFLSSNEEAISKIVVKDKVTITLSEDHTVTRPDVKGFDNLGWVIKWNGKEVLVRNAEGELSYQYFGRGSGEYEIYLNAFVEGQYVPVSNSVYYTIP